VDRSLKNFAFKCLKRLYIIIAVMLVLIALLLTSARVLFISVEDYKQQAMDWLTTKYQVDISVQDISAGIDFSGMVLILNDVELLDAEDLPFGLKFKYLFLHLDFWDSVTAQKLNFNRVSLQGVDLTLHNSAQNSDKGPTTPSKKSQITIDKLKDIFLTQLKKVSVKDSTLNYTNKFGDDKQIIIEELRWLNQQGEHQGVGQASFPNTLGKNSLKFVIDVVPETKNIPLSGNIYLQADNLNITDYLVDQVNTQAQISEAIVGFDAWATFSDSRINHVQIELTHNQLAWSLFDKTYHWGLNYGTLQLSNDDNGWLLDSYDLLMTHNDIALETPVKLSGKGDVSQALFDLEGFSVKNILPFYLLHSELNETQVNALDKFDIDANIKQLGIFLDSPNAMQFSLKANQFKNRPVGGIPGLSEAAISLQGSLQSGQVDISLGKQNIYFDGQFSRSMPLQSAMLDLHWQQTATGLKLFTEQAEINTDDLDTISDFALFLPNEKAQQQGAFLSLYTYASLNDASKARHYFPIKAMGKNVFNYLEPTLKEGHVDGAKILWYGAFNQYPYRKHNGIFQAWVPVRDAQYDFYGDWQGLTDLDLDLLFENDYLLMDAKKANLGAINIAQLSGKVDHLNPNGILTIKAEVTEDAVKVSDYLKASPLKGSVGKALSIIDVSAAPVSGKLTITVPFNRKKSKPQTEGSILLKNNKLKIELADDLVLPLEQVSGRFDFVNGNLDATNINATLFEQPVGIAFTTAQLADSYQIQTQLDGTWDLEKLSRYNKELAPLQLAGDLDWSGLVNFSHQYSGGYQYNVDLSSDMQGLSSKLPAPFYKPTLASWPTSIHVSGDGKTCRVKAEITDKLGLDVKVDYQQEDITLPYFTLNIGQSEIMYLDKGKQVINVNLDNLDLTDWHHFWRENSDFKLANIANPERDNTLEEESMIALDEVNVDVKLLHLFAQPFAGFQVRARNQDKTWRASVSSNNIDGDVEYRPGIPARIDIKAEKINLQALDLSLFAAQSIDTQATGTQVTDKQVTDTQTTPRNMSDNLLNDYPELFIDCVTCIYKNVDLSPLSAHIYPTKKRLNIDYIRVGSENEFINVAGFWDQRLTNIIFDTEGDREQDIVKRLGYMNPLYYQKAQLSGAVNWIGAPWEANLETLNGALSTEITDGAITEVSDKGTRLLSVFSLDGIHRSLNLEFDNVFAKGFNFDKITFSGNINDGIASNDDFYLTGSAGKITGNGLVDLPNQATNYNLSYSPAVTSSLPVLAAFTINPLTGAAVLMLTKLLEPVVDTIIRVDFSVTGDLRSPEVKLLGREQGKIKLDNSDVLQEMTERQKEQKDQVGE